MRCNGLCGFCQYHCSTEVIREVNEKLTAEPERVDIEDEVTDVESVKDVAVVEQVPHYEVRRGLFGQLIAKEKK